MVNTILARRVNHIVAKGDSPAWPKGSKSRGFSTFLKAMMWVIRFPYRQKVCEKSIERIIKQEKPDIVHTNTGVIHEGWKVCRNLGIRTPSNLIFAGKSLAENF